MVTNERKIILITDIIDQKVRKEKEIDFYEKELKKIEEKLFFLRKERQLTQFIIDIIEQEKVVDIREQMYERLENSRGVDTEGNQ
jgi:N-acetylglucosamine-6-phosphate deacetylase